MALPGRDLLEKISTERGRGGGAEKRGEGSTNGTLVVRIK